MSQDRTNENAPPAAPDESLLGSKGDPVEGRRDVPGQPGSPSDADREAEEKAG